MAEDKREALESEHSISDMIKFVKAATVELYQGFDKKNDKEFKKLIKALRRQNWLLYRRAKKEKNEEVKEMAQRIRAQIHVLKKNRDDKEKFKAACDIIIKETRDIFVKSRRKFLKSGVEAGAKLAAGTGFLGWLLGKSKDAEAASLKIVNDFSKKNRAAPVRTRTNFIILHTTEGNDGSSLNTVKKDGSCNYFISTKGKILRIIEKHKIAAHAGRSMWNNVRGLSRYSVGIEISGFHHKELTARQYSALKKLLVELKRIYGIKDNNILPHCQIAYGSPNAYNKKNHRPRRKCCMLLGTVSRRKKLGINSRPSYDPDLKAGRLVQSTDPRTNVVFKYIYGSMDAITKLPSPENPQPDNKGPGTIGKNGNKTASDIAGREFAESTTIYLMPNGMIRTGKEIVKDMKRRKQKFGIDVNRLPKGTRIFVGYIFGGQVTATRSAGKIAGKEWNYPTTYYVFPGGKVVPGNDVDPSKIPKGTIVLFQD